MKASLSASAAAGRLPATVISEHLAIDDTLRSRGYGKQLLAQILTRAPLTILEIDPLTTAIAHKRLRFYQSMGFHANPWAHHHPSYHQGIADREAAGAEATRSRSMSGSISSLPGISGTR